MSICINSKTDNRLRFSYNDKQIMLSFLDDCVLVMSPDFGVCKLEVSDVFHFLVQFIPYCELSSFFDENSLPYAPSLSNFLMLNFDCTIDDITSSFEVTRQTLYDWFLTPKIKRICAFGAYYRDVLSFDNLGIID